MLSIEEFPILAFTPHPRLCELDLCGAEVLESFCVGGAENGGLVNGESVRRFELGEFMRGGEPELGV